MAVHDRKTVISFSVQVGSAGFLIARLTAAQLGYSYYDSEITARAAELSGVSPESLASQGQNTMVGHLLSRLSMATATGEEVPSAMIDPDSEVLAAALERLGSASYRLFIEAVVEELAAREHCVIVGHGSQVVLSGPRVLKVLVRGSLRDRAERLAAERRTTYAEGQAIVDKLDSLRNLFFRQAYNVDWLDASLYDLTLNTDRLSADLAAEMLVPAARSVPSERRLGIFDRLAKGA